MQSTSQARNSGTQKPTTRQSKAPTQSAQAKAAADQRAAASSLSGVGKLRMNLIDLRSSLHS
jgi:hypothetical protein